MTWHNTNPAKAPQVPTPKAAGPKPATAKPATAKPVAAKPAAKPVTPATGHHHTGHHHHAAHKKVTHPHKPPHHHKGSPNTLSMPKANAKPVQPHTTHTVATTKQVTPDIITAARVKPPKKK